MKITPKEKRRAEKTKEQITKLHEQGYNVSENTITMTVANIMGLIFGLLILLPIGFAYYNKFGYITGGPDESILEMFLIVFLMFFVMVIHESIHGVFMYLFNGGDKSLIEFGMMSGNPYCTCQSPINKKQYILILLMPTIILGVVFCVIAFHLGKLWWLLLLVDIIVGGGGDLTIACKLLMTNTKDSKIIDHPYKCGFFLLSKHIESDMYEKIIYEIDNLKVSGKKTTDKESSS